MAKNLALFDNDGTLVRAPAGLTAQAFALGFKSAYGKYATITSIDYQGKTDREIIRDVMTEQGLDKKVIDLKMHTCAREMCEFYASVINSIQIEVLPGVRELLPLMRQNNFRLGLATGNFSPIARAKLKRVGLWEYFFGGGFGGDGHNRKDMVRRAIDRAEAYGYYDKIYLFGDTPLDVAAGKACGLLTVGVASGVYGMAELEKAGADIVLPDLFPATVAEHLGLQDLVVANDEQ